MDIKRYIRVFDLQISIPLANPRKPTGKATGLSSTPNRKPVQNIQSESFLTDIIKKAEQREKTILAEADALKECLMSIFKRIRKLQYQVSFLLTQKSAYDDDDTETAKFKLPFTKARESIECDIESALDVICSRVAPPTSSPSPPDTATVETLTRQLAEQQNIITQQTRLLELSLNSDYYIPPSSDTPPDDAFEVTSEAIAERAAAVYESERQLSLSRKAFTDAAVRLGFARVELDVCVFVLVG